MNSEVERKFLSAVEAIGGAKIDTTNWPDGKGAADFIFDDDGVIAEMKSMVGDRIAEKEIIRKATAFYEKARRSREASTLVFGRSEVSTSGFPDWYVREIYELYKKPVLKQVTKANKQIKDTKQILLKGEYKGLFILANSGNSAIGYEHAISILQSILGSPKYSCIDSVLYISDRFSGVSTRAAGSDRTYLAFNRKEHAEIEEKFFSRLCHAWQSVQEGA